MSFVEYQDKRYRTERQSSFRLYKQRAYVCGQDAGLSDLDLELGDTLPEDSDYEIISSEIRQDAKGGRFVVINSVKEQLTTGSPWSELTGTRQVDRSDPRQITYTITFTGATNAALPALGVLIGDATVMGGSNILASTGLDTAPQIVAINWRKQVTTNKAHMQVVFRAFYIVNSSDTWKEIVGTRRAVDQSPQEKSWEIAFVGAADSTPPANGDVLTDIDSVATPFGSTGLDGEPRVVAATVQKKVTSTKDIVTVRFRAFVEYS